MGSRQKGEENGYGICTYDINTTEERLLQLIKMAPSFAAGYIEWAESTNGEGEFIEEATLEELLEWEDDYGYVGLAPIMRAVLEEKENIRFVVAEDFNGIQYRLSGTVAPATYGIEKKLTIGSFWL